MNESNLRSILYRLGVRPEKITRKGWVQFRCPIAQWTHKNGADRSASAAAVANPTGKSSWVCKACHHKGTLYGLVSDLGRYRNADYSAVLQAIRDDETTGLFNVEFGRFEDAFETTVDEPLNPAVYAGLWPDAWDVPEARAYLQGRGIGEATTRSLGLMCDDDEHRILFPVKGRGGELWGFSGRAMRPHIEPRIKDYEGLPKRRVILGAERWAAGKPLLIEEGLFGYAHLIEIGAERVANVGALLGSVVTPEKAELICMEDAPTFLLLDNDSAGEMGLFGTFDTEGVRNPDGAVHLLQGHVPLFIPPWPVWERGGLHLGGQHGPGEEKTDPDQLTLEDVETIIADTELYGFARIR